MPPMAPAEPLARVRAVCLSFPDTSERLSHGSPTFFIRGKHPFVMYLDNHHGDGRLALWCATPAAMQEALVEAEPLHYFVPPYVGPSGWTGVRLDKRLAWGKVTAVIEQAYQHRASKLPKPRPRVGAVKSARSPRSAGP
jgi:hypothetical protein